MGVSGQRHAPAALLPPGKGPPVPIVQEAGWAPEPGLAFMGNFYEILLKCYRHIEGLHVIGGGGGQSQDLCIFRMKSCKMYTYIHV
jgi:hypothetical protein